LRFGSANTWKDLTFPLATCAARRRNALEAGQGAAALLGEIAITRFGTAAARAR
jgi:hypothetical protein